MRVGAVGSYAHVMTNDKIKDKKGCINEINNKGLGFSKKIMKTAAVECLVLTPGLLASTFLKNKNSMLSNAVLGVSLLASGIYIIKEAKIAKEAGDAYQEIETKYEQ